MSILEVVLVPSWWPDGWPHVTSCYLRLPHVMSARTRISHRATSIKLEMTPPVAAADTCFHFFVWGCILMITVPWWPFLHPGPAGRCVIMVTLELMVLVRPSSPDSFSPAPPVSPWSLLTMQCSVVSSPNSISVYILHIIIQINIILLRWYLLQWQTLF